MALYHPFLLFLLLITTKLTLTRYRRGLRGLPGPFLASFTSLWKIYIVWREDMPWTSIKLHKKLGPLVRIGPNHVSVAHPTALKVIYGADSSYNKSMFYRTAQARYEGHILPNMFSTDDLAYHARVKRTTGHLYSISSILELEHLLNSCVDAFLSRMREFSSPNQIPVNMSAWLQFYTFDCLGVVSFSRPIGFLSSGTDIDSMIEAVDKIFDYVSLVGQMPFIDKLLLGNPLLSWLKPNVQSSGGILNFALNKAHRQRQQRSKRNDILSRLYEIHEAHPENLSFRDVVGAISINIFAGHDALAISLRSVLYHLCKNPHAYDKVTREIREADKAGRFSPITSYVEAVSLPYLSAVINEAIRIHPAVGLILERQVPRNGATICNAHIPPGTIVGINAWVLHRDESIFGPDVEEFRPERWIDGSPEQLNAMRRNLFTFGAGSRACIGRGIAMIEIFKLLAELCRTFDFRLEDPGREWHVQGTWVTKQTNMDMIFTQLDREVH